MLVLHHYLDGDGMVASTMTAMKVVLSTYDNFGDLNHELANCLWFWTKLWVTFAILVHELNDF